MSVSSPTPSAGSPTAVSFTAILPPSSYEVSEKGEVTINGKLYEVKNLTIAGKVQNLEKPLSPQQRSAIQALIQEVLSKIRDSLDSERDLDSIKITTDGRSSAEVETQVRGSAAATRSVSIDQESVNLKLQEISLRFGVSGASTDPSTILTPPATSSLRPPAPPLTPPPPLSGALAGLTLTASADRSTAVRKQDDDISHMVKGILNRERPVLEGLGAKDVRKLGIKPRDGEKIKKLENKLNESIPPEQRKKFTKELASLKINLLKDYSKKIKSKLKQVDSALSPKGQKKLQGPGEIAKMKEFKRKLQAELNLVNSTIKDTIIVNLANDLSLPNELIEQRNDIKGIKEIYQGKANQLKENLNNPALAANHKEFKSELKLLNLKFLEDYSRALEKGIKGINSPLEKALKKELKVLTSALKTAGVVVHPEFGLLEEIARGKAKVVWKSSVKPGVVYYTPVKGFSQKYFKSKEKEIQSEVEKSKLIQDRLVELHRIRGDQESNLAFDLVEIEGGSKIGGEYTVEAQAAEGDLEDRVNGKKDPLRFPISADVGLQIVNGMANLHGAGWVHGDLKLENVLLVKKGAGADAKYIAKIADFGKTERLGPNESMMHTGNPRFQAPEGRRSQKGEVYSTGIMLIHLLEGEFLNPASDNPKDHMLKTPDRQDPDVDSSKRFGVEKFLVDNLDCPQTEVNSLRGKGKAYGRELRLALPGTSVSTTNLDKAEKEIYDYIDVLADNLLDRYSTAEEQIGELRDLLRTMTSSDPNRRFTMDQVVTEYTRIMSSFASVNPPAT